MAVLAVFTGVGFTRQMYESLRSVVQWETKLARGGLVHAAAFDESGDLHVADVWNSADDMNEFVAQRLIPGFQKLNIPMPAVQVFPLHNLNIYPAAASYQLG